MLLRNGNVLDAFAQFIDRMIAVIAITGVKCRIEHHAEKSTTHKLCKIMREHVTASVSKTFQGHIDREQGLISLVENCCSAIHVHSYIKERRLCYFN